jgi:cytochrome c peroxidase
VFPLPEGTTQFPANSPSIRHLLIAQAHLPPTELSEVAGFTGTKGTLDPRLDQFDDGFGSVVPMPDASGFRNDAIRAAVVKRLNANKTYVGLFGQVFPEVKDGRPITALMFAQAIAEFEFNLVRANAPIDQFARGQQQAMNASEKRGALLFFGKANCVACHTVAGQSNEMFSDFKNHVAGVPQIAPYLGRGLGNVIFDGPGVDEDFGLEQFTGNAADRYKFRTSPLRNVSLQPTFFHNGAFVDLTEAIKFHMNTSLAARQYNAKKAGVATDLTYRQGPIEPVLQRLSPLLSQPIQLSENEFKDLVRFVDTGLLDPRAKADNLCKFVPDTLPSKFTPLKFQGCKQDKIHE